MTTFSTEALARLERIRRDRRVATLVFAAKAFGLPVVTLSYLWWVTHR